MVHILEKKNQSRDILSSYPQPKKVEEIEKNSIVKNVNSDPSHQVNIKTIGFLSKPTSS